MNWQPPPPPPRPGAGAPQGGAQTAEQEQSKELTLYQLLQIDKDAHVTIIRYAYRFLAAMYHPDNGETGDAEKFRVITEAW
ncbi:MAG TPA: DnaJ domain-containing protein, partial [Trichormus sp.]